MKKECPCKSQKPYAECCEPYHKGKLPEKALLLMRSRFSAYALGLADYIIDTTYPTHRPTKKEVLDFSDSTEFRGLKILEFIDGDQSAYVTFTASLFQNGRDVSFTEKSHFLKGYPNNLKNRFLTSSDLSQKFHSHSRLASGQWSLAPNEISENPSCQIPDSSGCLGINGKWFYDSESSRVISDSK